MGVFAKRPTFSFSIFVILTASFLLLKIWRHLLLRRCFAQPFFLIWVSHFSQNLKVLSSALATTLFCSFLSHLIVEATRRIYMGSFLKRFANWLRSFMRSANSIIGMGRLRSSILAKSSWSFSTNTERSSYAVLIPPIVAVSLAVSEHW